MYFTIVLNLIDLILMEYYHLTDGYCNDLSVERRRHSHHLECLFNFYMRMLCRHHQEMKLSKLWEYIVQGLDIYPCSPNLYNALVEIGHLYVSPNKLRWIFDEKFQKYDLLNLFLQFYVTYSSHSQKSSTYVNFLWSLC